MVVMLRTGGVALSAAGLCSLPMCNVRPSPRALCVVEARRLPLAGPVSRAAEASLPSKHGPFKIIAYHVRHEKQQPLALVIDTVRDGG